MTNDKTNKIWNKNLIFAELIIFKSEKIPNIKIKNVKRINDKIFWSKKYKTPRNKNIPPDKGIFKSEANFWCSSPVKLIKNFFLFNKTLNNIIKVVIKTK